MLVRGIELDMLELTVAKKLLKVFEIAVLSEESTPLIDISVIDEWLELRCFPGFFAESAKLCS